MFRFTSRPAAAAVIAILFALVCLPAAEARGFGPARTAFDLDTPWLDSAISLLGRFLGGAPEPPARQAKPKLGKVTANSGSCIDPQGIPRPCLQP